MKRAHLLLSGAAALAAVFSLAAPAAAAVQLPFFAESGDKCQYGYTKGVLSLPTVPTRVVHVAGVVVDRPAEPGIPELCPDDGRFSFAVLIAYTGTTAVDGERVAVDNGAVDYKLDLTSTSTTRPIDRVSVQVCRQPRLVGGPPAYCGVAQDYRLPIS
jgi:hypothetical protein